MTCFTYSHLTGTLADSYCIHQLDGLPSQLIHTYGLLQLMHTYVMTCTAFKHKSNAEEC